MDEPTPSTIPESTPEETPTSQAHPFAKSQAEASEPAGEPVPMGTNPFDQKKTRTLRRRIITWSFVGLIAVVGLTAWIIAANRGGILILEPTNDFTITLNGEPAKLTPESDGVLIKARPGVYRLRLTRPNYDPYVADITVKRGQTVKLRPVFSILPQQAVDSDGSVAFVRPSVDGTSVFYYVPSNGTIYRMDLASQTQVPITNAPITGVKDIEWSGDRNVALLTLNDGLYLQEIPILNFESQVQVKIAGTDSTGVIWDPTNSQRLAFLYNPGTGEHSLAIADKRISAIEHKADISMIPNPHLVWSPNASYIALIAGSTDASQNDIWIYTTANGSLTQITTSGHVVDASFSPDSATLLYQLSTNDPSNPLGNELHTVKPDGHAATSLDVPGTIATVAWKDATHFYLPEAAAGDLALYGLDGSKQTAPFSFPTDRITSMFYFSSSQELITATQHSIYLSDLAK